MSKEMVYIEPVEIFSYGHNPEHQVVMIHFDGYRSGAYGTEEFLMDFPMHQDYYDAMKYYCSEYEKFMLEKFAGK